MKLSETHLGICLFLFVCLFFFCGCRSKCKSCEKEIVFYSKINQANIFIILC